MKSKNIDKKFILDLKKIIIRAGQLSIELRDKGLTINRKDDNSPVTNADIEISNFIYYNLTNLTPNIPVICEEQNLKIILGEKIIWLVDPIDGTKSYIKNMDSFTVNIALIENQIPVLGMIYHPTSGKLYFTDHNGKFCIEQNGLDVKVLERNDDSRIAIISCRNFNKKTEEYIKNNNFSEIIAIPSSIKLCMIAEGVGDVYPKFGQTMEWDIAAGHALINAAGGTIIDNETTKELLYCKDEFKNHDFIAYRNYNVQT